MPSRQCRGLMFALALPLLALLVIFAAHDRFSQPGTSRRIHSGDSHTTDTPETPGTFAFPAARGLSQSPPSRMRGNESPSDAGSQGKCRAAWFRPYLIADDRGYVCSRDDWSGSPDQCCPGGAERHVCDKCDLSSGCCREFEWCVSCCLSPNAPTIRGRGVTKWVRCLDKCRTSSKSIKGGNRYASPIHHCMGKTSNAVSSHGRGEPRRPAPVQTDSCVMWRQTGGCGKGAREPSNDLTCSTWISDGLSGFCECRSGAKFKVGCNHQAFTCNDKCLELANSAV